MNRHGGWLLLLAMLAGCVEEAPPGATGVALPGPGAAPTPAPRTLEALAGEWVFGDRGEPASGPVSTCDPGQVMTLYQSGNSLHGDVQTCRSATVCTTLEAFQGAVTQGRVQFAGSFKGNQQDNAENVTYDLVFDAASQHLTGTRNGRAFWAAPRFKPSQADCDRRKS